MVQNINPKPDLCRVGMHSGTGCRGKHLLVVCYRRVLRMNQAGSADQLHAPATRESCSCCQRAGGIGSQVELHAPPTSQIARHLSDSSIPTTSLLLLSVRW